MVKEYVKREIIELVWLISYITLVIGIFSLAFGLGFGGFERESILQKNIFYIGYGVLFLIGLVSIKVAGIFLFTEDDEVIEGSLIHDPEQGLFPKWRLFKNPWLLSYFSIIVVSLLGWFASRYQTFFSAVPKYQQQFTKGADIFFSVYPASPSETLGALFLISLIGLILGIMVKRGKLGRMTFLFMFIIGGTTISIIYGVINHIARYSGSDVAMGSVIFFWSLTGLVTTVSGSIIPAFILHDGNNFFYKFSRLFSSDVTTYITFSIISLGILLFLIFYFRKRDVSP